MICCHPLTHCSRDFDFLAEYLLTIRNTQTQKPAFRVVTVDVVGRGQSSRLHTPSLYTYTTYLSDMTTLIARVTAG